MNVQDFHGHSWLAVCVPEVMTKAIHHNIEVVKLAPAVMIYILLIVSSRKSGFILLSDAINVQGL